MNPKALFLIGIIGIHGALAAGMAASDPPLPRVGMVCNPVDAPWPDFTPPRVLMTSNAWVIANEVLVPTLIIVDLPSSSAAPRPKAGS